MIKEAAPIQLTLIAEKPPILPEGVTGQPLVEALKPLLVAKRVISGHIGRIVGVAKEKLATSLREHRGRGSGRSRRCSSCSGRHSFDEQCQGQNMSFRPPQFNTQISYGSSKLKLVHIY